MSPVSAVFLRCAGLVGQSPAESIRRLPPALLGGTVVALATTLRLG